MPLDNLSKLLMRKIYQIKLIRFLPKKSIKVLNDDYCRTRNSGDPLLKKKINPKIFIAK